jgi:hypothetical protein
MIISSCEKNLCRHLHLLIGIVCKGVFAVIFHEKRVQYHTKKVADMDMSTYSMDKVAGREHEA